jgi:hypothetical protein
MWLWKRRKPKADPARIAELERELGITEAVVRVEDSTSTTLCAIVEKAQEVRVLTDNTFTYTTSEGTYVAVYDGEKMTVVGSYPVVTPENFLSVVAADGLRKYA